MANLCRGRGVPNGLKPRPWADKLIGATSANTPLNAGGQVFDLTRDGTRIIAWEPQEQEAKVDLQVTILLNWFDELRRRLPPSGK